MTDPVNDPPSEPTKEQLFKAGIAQLRSLFVPQVTQVLADPYRQREVVDVLRASLVLAVSKVLEELDKADLDGVSNGQ